MTAKDFTLIARTIASLPLPIAESSAQEEMLRDSIATRFADNLEQTNPRFDRERFIKAATSA